MTITVKHAKTNAITDWTQPQLDAQIAAGNFPPGTTLAQIVIPSDWNNDHTLTGTIDVANGGTGLTTLTANYIPYGNGTSPFQSSANFTFNGTTVTTANDISVNGLTVGMGGGALSTNTVLGAAALNGANTGTGSNTAIGNQSLRYNTTGNHNTAVGLNSLINNTTGVRNTGIGSGALTQHKTGSDNTAIGYFAQFNATLGTSNVSVGNNSLQNNTTGTNNTAVGLSALAANTTNVATLGSITAGTGYTNGTYTARAMTPVSGATFVTYPTVDVTVAGGVVTAVTLVTNGVGASSTAATVLTVAAALIGGTGSGFSIPVATFGTGVSNTAVGYQSLSLNTTGNYNTALGGGDSGAFSPLRANTTASFNTAIGNGALGKNTTGFSNTAVGYQALLNNLTGQGNVAFGGNTSGSVNGALNTNTAGSNNTAIGSGSLQAATGSDNTALGWASGLSVSTGTQNTLIGRNAGQSGANNLTTGSNNIIIGYLTSGSAAGVSNEITIGNASNTALRFPPLITGYTSAAPTVASAATIAPTKPISFVSGTTTIDTITAPAPISAGGGSITLIPTGIFATSILGNIALATTAVVGKALILTYDATTTKWYPSY